MYAKYLYIIFACTLVAYSKGHGQATNASDTLHKPVIVISKTDYTLQFINSKGELTIFPVVFGTNVEGDKMEEGDRKTPEGVFTLTAKIKHDRWRKFLRLNYPNQDSYNKFSIRMQQGLINSKAKIGNDIGIHGTWPNEDFLITHRINWTQGCISMKNEDVDSLYKMVEVGTSIIINP